MTNQYNLPYIPDAVKRQRLFTHLNAHSHKQNFLISGQAAQGKTTLVASYLQQKSSPVLWVDLSNDDKDHAKLFNRIVTGINKLFARNEENKNVAIFNTVLGTNKGLQRHIESLNMILGDLPFPLFIVLDDLERIEDRSSGFELINGILNNHFKHLRLFLLSRSIPPINIVQLKMAKNIFILDNKDLSFTLEETMFFFKDKTSVNKNDIEKIHKITDGWAGGLTLVSESLRQFKGVGRLPDRLSADVFNYFSQEIYQRLPDHIRDFLIKTSVFDTIDLDIANQLFGAPEAFEILTELEKRNLFIQRIESDSRQPIFKYHNLFKEFLLQNFLTTKGNLAYKQLNQKIGTIFWKQKDYPSAMNYFIEAGSFPDMVHIIRIKGTDHIIKGNMSDLNKWIHCLPDKMIQNDPWLIFFQTMTRRIKGGEKNIKQFQKAFELFNKNEDIRGMLLSAGYLIEAAVFVRQPSAMILEWIQKGEHKLRSIRWKEKYPWARALLLQQIGLGYIAGNGNFPKGVSACQNAILLARQIDNPDLISNASIIMTFGYVQAGDFVNARQMLSKIKSITSQGQNPEYRALKSIVDIDFALNNGRFEDTKQLLDRFEIDIEKFGLIFLYPRFIEAKALYLIHTDQFDDARKMAEHLSDFSILEGNDFYMGISFRIKAISFLLEENFAGADREIKKALTEFDPSKKGDIHHFLTQQVAGLIHFRKKEYLKAREVLMPALQYFERISSELSCSETCLALGLISYNLKDIKAALTYLSQGLEKAFEKKYRFFPLISQKLLIQSVLLMVVYDKLTSLKPYALSLISRYSPQMIFDQIDQVLAVFKTKEKFKAVENLGHVYKSLLPGIRIETLGQFNIYLGSTILDKKTFEGTKPIQLLKSIVLHGTKDIPKEILIDDLWPEATSAAGGKNFKINLHRLRKTMEPNPKKEFGYSYIIQKAGLISIDPEMIRIDVDEFINFGALAIENERLKQFDSALEFYEKACTLYKGDYFSEEPYLEWITRKRDLFRSRYMELLQKKALLHEELDQTEKAIQTWCLTLNTDPYFETAYQNLMILYADSGRKKKAMDLFSKYTLLLKKELEIEPMEETLSLFKAIQLR